MDMCALWKWLDRPANNLRVLLVAACILFAGHVAIQAQSIQHAQVIRVGVEAVPSTRCFPASSLQQSELEEDFLRICPQCRLVADPAQPADYRVVVEDPGFGWRLLLIDDRGSVSKVLEWEGPLELGLSVAVLIIRDNLLVSMDAGSEFEVGLEENGHGPKPALIF